MTQVGYTSAALIATGIVIPLGLEWAALTNFVGYVVWRLWLLAMATILWRSSAATTMIDRSHTLSTCSGSRYSGRSRSGATAG